ncbi:Lrp/AsnC family transcriptional regulator [soil metagenome]|nr:Lrp/AsnC family transcriptional regulator [Actinomycetota bacterium]
MDGLDEQLLALLRDDARLSMADLGRRVGLSRTATLARVRRLEDEGAIRGYHAEVAAAPTAAGHAARVAIVINTPDVAAYVRRLRAIPELQEAESVAGEYDLLVRLAAADAGRLDAILDRINAWPQTVRTTTFVVLTRYPLASPLSP